MEYTQQAKEALQIAQAAAKELNHPYVGTEHLLIGLRKVYTGVAGQILAANGVDEENIRKIVDELVSPSGEVPVVHNPKYSPRLECILEESREEAQKERAEKTGTEHMLLVLLRDVECVATRMLITLNLNVQKMFQEVLAVIGISPKEYQEEMQQAGPGRKGGILEQYGTDLTELAAEGGLDPVIGREAEINRLMQILSLGKLWHFPQSMCKFFLPPSGLIEWFDYVSKHQYLVYRNQLTPGIPILGDCSETSGCLRWS